MTVRELIAKLQTLDPDKEVHFTHPYVGDSMDQAIPEVQEVEEGSVYRFNPPVEYDPDPDWEDEASTEEDRMERRERKVVILR